MRIVGIDCGTERTGYGVIWSDGRIHEFLRAGVICTKPTDPLELRLKKIAAELREVFHKANAEWVAVEGVFHAVNSKSALKLAHVRGVALLVAAESGLRVSAYSPLEVKSSVVGYGRAEKQQVQMMVRSLLRIEERFDSYDATDALAVAICHGTHFTQPQIAAAR
jgi:crossover junction endodeoxyribonuclease RuvC